MLGLVARTTCVRMEGHQWDVLAPSPWLHALSMSCFVLWYPPYGYLCILHLETGTELCGTLVLKQQQLDDTTGFKVSKQNRPLPRFPASPASLFFLSQASRQPHRQLRRYVLSLALPMIFHEEFQLLRPKPFCLDPLPFAPVPCCCGA